MTQNKVQKAAIRRRMAETGESYVVARHAILDDVDHGGLDAEPLTPEELYAREAAAAGASADEIDAATVAFRLEAAAERAQQAAGQARVRADQAQQAAEQAEERAGLAEEAAEEAEEWAEPAERQLLRERAAQLQEAAEQAQLRAELDEEAAVAAEERAELAADAAGDAADREAHEAVGDEPGWFWADTLGDEGFGPPAPPVPPMPPVPPRPPVQP